MSSPISSALEKLDGSLLALQSEVDCLKAGLEVSDEQVRQRLAEARQHATVVRDLIRADRGDAKWGDREALDLLILELEIVAQEKVSEERRTRLLELASEFEAGSIKHRFESRVSALNALRQEAIDQLRADAALKELEKVLPGPEAGEWLSWACNLQEEADASTLDQLQRDFPAVAGFTGEMEESYWVPGTRGAVAPTRVPASQPPAQPAKESAPAKPAAPPAPVAKQPPPPAPPVAAKPPAPVAPPPAAKPPAPAAPPAAAAKPSAPVAPPVPAAKQPEPAAPPAAAKQSARVEAPAPAAKETKPVEAPPRQDKKPVTPPAAPSAAPPRTQVAVAAAAVAQEKPAPAVAAQVAQPAASAKAAPAKETRPAVEPARPSAPAKQWQAAAPAPAKEPTEKKAVAAVTAAAPSVTAAPRTKYCDKCGSTYPVQFNVCPIDSSPLRYSDEPAAATKGRDGAGTVDKVEAVAVAAAAVAAEKASSKSRPAEASSAPKARESSKLEVQELRATIKHHDEEVTAGEHKAADWQTALRDKNWAALAANPVVLAAATLVLILIVGGIVWKVRSHHTTNDSVKAMEKAPDQPAANAQPGLVTDSVAQPVTASPSTTTTSKPADQNNNKQNAQLAKEAQPKPENQPENQPKPAQVLSLPMPGPRDVATAKKPEPAANDPIEPPSSIPGALPNASPNNLGAIAKDVPVAVPTLNQQKLRVSSGVAQAQLTHKISPQYPPEAFQSRVHGTVVLQAVIGKDGGVKTLKVVSGPPMLIKSATEAVKQWRYKPFTLNGEPVEADTQINVNFSLE